jgi:hypothetical protein
LSTTQIFESQAIPDGYKFILEEDTGECFLILLDNGNSTQPDYFTSGLNFSNESANTQIYINNGTSDFSGNGPLNTKAQFSFYLKDEKSEPEATGNQNEQVGQQTRPQFLSQASVNNILVSLNDNTNNNQVISNTGEPLNLFDNQFLNESWFETFMAGSELIESSLTENQTQIDTGYDATFQLQQQQQQIASQPTVDESTINGGLIDINRNQSLLVLNLNQSILNDAENQTYFTQMPQELQQHSVEIETNTSQVVMNELNGK